MAAVTLTLLQLVTTSSAEETKKNEIFILLLCIVSSLLFEEVSMKDPSIVNPKVIFGLLEFVVVRAVV